MGVKEFEDIFDVLYNNITSNQAPGLNSYEKSVFLTKGQLETVKNHVNAKSNPKGEGFDDSPKRQVDFSTIMDSAHLSPITAVDKFDPRSFAYILPSNLFISLSEQLTSDNTIYTVNPLSYQEYNVQMTKPYKYPPKYQAWRLITKNVSVYTPNTVIGKYNNYTLRIVSSYNKPVRFRVEAVTTTSSAPIISESDNLVTIVCRIGPTINNSNGVPVTVNNTIKYWQLFLAGSDKATAPYVGDFSGGEGYSSFPVMPIDSNWTSRVLFDITNSGGTPTENKNTIVEIIGRFPSTPDYRIRYIKRPRPIILTDLPDGLTIQGETSAQTSELPEELHEEILQRAVELAKVAWQGDAQATIQSGQRSE